MYFINVEKIEERLQYMEELLQEVKIDALHNESKTDQLALERYTEVLIEIILDVGHMMIDGFIMRDAGSYEDIIDILQDEAVLNKQNSESYVELVQYRKIIVKQYDQVDFKQLKQLMRKHHSLLLTFPHDIRAYLKKDDEVAHTFNAPKTR